MTSASEHKSEGNPAEHFQHFNMCGVLVHARPERVPDVVSALNALDGVHVHEVADGGRIITTIEDTQTSIAIDTLSAIHRLKGVVAAGLVYHHFEPPPADRSGTEEEPK
jgi:periplasmic nitrate reductase NapD